MLVYSLFSLFNIYFYTKHIMINVKQNTTIIEEVFIMVAFINCFFTVKQNIIIIRIVNGSKSPRLITLKNMNLLLPNRWRPCSSTPPPSSCRSPGPSPCTQTWRGGASPPPQPLGCRLSRNGAPGPQI